MWFNLSLVIIALNMATAVVLCMFGVILDVEMTMVIVSISVFVMVGMLVLENKRID